MRQRPSASTYLALSILAAFALLLGVWGGLKGFASKDAPVLLAVGTSMIAAFLPLYSPSKSRGRTCCRRQPVEQPVQK